MYLKKLIEKAQKAYEENGNIPVAVYADRGQDCEIAYGCGIQYRNSDGESYYRQNILDDEIGEYKKVFEIQGN